MKRAAVGHGETAGSVPGDRRPGSVHSRLLVSTFFRSFTIQGSWNYRTMIGGGFAFALLPLLRFQRGERGPALEDALSRHSVHFNAHPYLAGLALGAVARLELDGEKPEVVERFKAAVRGPLGGLGDRLVWAGWLPTTLLLSLVATWAGLPPAFAIGLFVLVYNAGHLGLRAWGFRTGFSEGAGVGARLREASLGHWAELLFRSGAVLVGVLLGLLLVTGRTFGGTDPFWALLGAVAFALGVTGGHRVWRPTALAMVSVILLVFLLRTLP